MLTVLWVLPALGGLVGAAAGRRLSWLGPLAAAVALVLCLSLWGQAGHLVETANWIGGPFTVSYRLGLSGLSLVLVAMTLLITCVAGFAGRAHGPAFTAWMCALGAAATGLFLARNLVLFYIFWELTLIPAYFLLVGWGGPGRQAAAWRFLLYNIGGSVALLLGIAALVAFGVHMPGLGAGLNAGLPAGLPAGLNPGLNPGGSLALTVPPALVVPVGVALFIAFAVKTPLWPLHGWVADTYAELPAPAAALVGGVQSKAGLYGMLALLIPLLPGAVRAWQPVFFAVAAVSLLYGAFCALAAKDPRRLIAYSSVSHLGLVMLAFLTLQRQALAGGVIQMIAHGIFTAALFLLVGMLERRMQGPVDLGKLGGLARSAPALAGGLILMAMAALGLPGLAGFPGELLMLVGIWHTNILLAVLGAIALVVAAAYMLRLVQLVLHGPRDGKGVDDLGAVERWLLAPLAVVLLLVGLWPQPIPRQAQAAVGAALAAAPASTTAGGNG